MGATNFDTVYASGLVYSKGVPSLPNVPFTTGTYFFVGSTVAGASDNNSGLDPTVPMATVNAAIAKCVASRGDVILLMPGHAETVTATSIALNVAGVRIVGLGTGLLRPTFTYGAAAATITVTGANCGWDNCHFIANFLNVASAFTIGAAKEFQVTNSTFVDTSSILNFLCIVTTGAVNNDADGLLFNRNYVYGLATTDGAVVSILANELRVQICDNVVDKAATNDAGHLVTLSSKILGGIRIMRNVLTVVGSAGAAVGVLGTGSGATSSGICADNYVWSLDTTAALLFTAGTGIRFIQNFMSGAVDASGSVYPAADNPA